MIELVLAYPGAFLLIAGLILFAGVIVYREWTR